jgi:anti-sigma factor (TIGR02949 family)
MKKTTTNGKGEMSNGETYSLCPEFMKLVHLVMDGEANTEEEQLFLAHIEANEDCKDHYMEEQSIRSILKEKCGNVAVPDQLIHAIQLKLQELSVS